MKKFFISISFIFSFLLLNAQYRTENESLQFEGIDRSFEIFIPENYSPDKKYPVVFILHGGGGTAKGLIKNTRARFNQLANRDGFFAVYPDGFEKSWNDGARDTFGVARKRNINDVGYILKVLDMLNSKLSVDRRNVFACGISNGGFMAQRLAFEHPEVFKGIGIVAANLSLDQSEKPKPKSGVSALFIHGTHDPLVPFNGGPVTVFRQKRGEVLSATETIETWKKINGSTTQIETFTFPDINKKDGCTATKTSWKNPANPQLKTVSIVIENGGHTWPGAGQYLPVRLVGPTNRDFNGCDEIWNFFKTLM